MKQNNYIKNKQGMTIIELIVAMGIFTIVTTLAVGSFVAISRMRMFALNLKESQQKVRIMTEMISRYARQADIVTVSDDNKKVDMYFKLDTFDATVPADRQAYASSFELYNSGGNYLMRYYECTPTTTSKYCLGTLTAADGVDLFSGKMKLSADSGFAINSNQILKDDKNDLTEEMPASKPSMDIVLKSNLNDKTTTPYYNSDYFAISTKVVLENLK